MEEWHFRHTVRAGKFTGKIYNQHGTTYAKAKNYSKNRESGVLDDDTIFAEEHIWFPNGAQCPDCEDMRPVHTDPEPVTPVGPSQNMVLNQSHYLKKLAPIFGGQTQKLEETTEIKFDKEAKKGYLVCQGAKLYCIKSANANNKGSALPFTKLSQEKIVLANEMPVATTKDNTVAHINFGSCASKYPNVPCAARLQWKHINKNIEVGGGYPLLSISKADCNAMGEKEVVSIAEHGQGNEVSSVLEDSTTASSKIYLVSPLIRPAKAKKKPSVTAISLFHNNKKIQGNSSLSIEKKANKKHCFRFEASFKNGSEWRINWAIYKKKDSELIKLKEYRNHGKILQFETDQQTETGEFIIEAFGRKSNPTRYKKCTIQIQYQANGILENSIQNTHNTSTVLAEEVIAFSCKKRFDSPLNIQWYVYEITEEAKILYYSPELPKPTIDKPQNIWQNLFGMVTNRSLGDGMDIEPYQFSILFKNQGTYLVVAEDANGKRISKEFKAVSHPKLNKISHGPIKLSPNQHIEAAVTKSNVALDSLEHKNCYWHLKKGGKVFPFQTQGTSFQLAVKELQYRGLTSNLYGSYILEASGDGTKGNFSGTDSYLFEVCNNYLVQIPNIPIYLPIGAKWKPKPILNMPQQLDQKMVFSSTNLEDLSKLQLSDSVQINALGSYKLYAQLEGEYTDTTKGLDIQIQAVHIQFKKALWCYGNNRKRWQIGAGEIAFAYLKLQHLSNHPINISIWVQGEVSSPGEAMSDPKNLLLTQSAKIDAQGNAQLKFETTEEMVEKIQNALNLIELENIPLFFTFSLHKKNMSFELGDNVQIIDANGDQIPQIAVDGVAHYIVLEPSERLVYTQQQKVKSVLFSNPEKTDIQLGKTTKEVTHAIWVHTTGMVGQKLSLAVYQKMGDDTVAASFSSSTTTADNQSMAQGVVASAVEKYEDQEIPKSGYLQLDFSVPAWTPEDQSAFFSIEVFQKQPDGSIKDMGHGYQSSFVQKYIAPDLNQVEIQALVDLDNATDEIKAKIAKKLVCHNQLYAVPPNLLPAQTDTSPTVAEVAEGERHFSRCVCKNYDLIWGDKLNCSQRKKVVEVCKNLWGEAQKIEKANQLLAVMHLETGRSFSASADNENGYVGLIQFSSGAAASLGTSQRDLKQMTFVEQMDYVEKYLSKKKDKLNSMTDMYLQVLKPNAVGNGNNPDYIIFDESIPLPDGDGKNTSAAQRELNIQRDPWVKKLGYKSNPYFMVEEGEKKKREKWNYTKQKMELKEGFHGGKTAVWEVEQVLTNNHYLKGQANKFDGKCVDILINKMQEETAPWIIKAWREYFNYFGKREKDDPLKQRIKEYFYKTKNDGYDHKKAWCAAFVNFCFYLTSDYKHTNTKGTAGAYDWAEYSNDKVKNNEGKDGWKNGELSEPFIGAVIVFSFSHVAFIVGENLDGSKYVFLGGNQEGWEGKKSGTQIISLSSIDKNSNQIYRIMKPKGYEIPKSQKTLKKYDVETENSFDSTR